MQRSSAIAFRPARGRSLVAAVAVVMAGCSDGSPETPSRPVARRTGPVPEVVSQPEAFRAAAPAAVAAAPSRQPVAVVPPALLAAATGAATGDAVGEIKAMLAAYLRDFNRHDPEALAAHWTDRGESVDLASGEVTAGREAVRAVFTSLFATDADATIDIDVASVRPVRNDVAVVDGETRLSFADGGRSKSRFSAVVVKERGRWMMESLRESPQPGDAAATRPLDELAWLLGAWEDVGEGVTASTQCFWSAGRGFLVRSHAVQADRAPEDLPVAGDTRIPGLLPADDAGSRELTEIIGWDPDHQTIRSWVFTSAGRFAEGTWTKQGDTWTVRYEGRGRDEGTACECTLERLGVDGLVARCSSDALASLLPPACEFTRTARLVE